MNVERYEGGDGEEIGEVYACPVCDKPWLVLMEEDAEYPDDCTHLRFVLSPMGELDSVVLRNGMTQATFVAEIEDNYQRLFPGGDATNPNQKFAEVLSEWLFEDDALEQAEIVGVDTVVTYTSRMAGSNFSSVFGAKLR